MSSEILNYFGEGYRARVLCAERRGKSPHDMGHIRAKLGRVVQIEFPAESLSDSGHYSTAGESDDVRQASNASRIFDEH